MEVHCYQLNHRPAAAALRAAEAPRANRSAAWQGFSATARGAKHVAKGLPNQDAVLVARSHHAGFGVVIAGGDGHGSPEYVRSHRGSAIACAAAAKWGVKFLTSVQNEPRVPIRVWHGQVVSQKIREEWLAAVRAHHAKHPFTPEEWQEIPDRELRQFIEHPETAYGTTLLAAIGWKEGLLALQLGDGDIVRVDGDEIRYVIDSLPDDGPATDSLCDESAVDKFRIHVEQFHEPPPSHVMLRTDGWTKSFENNDERVRADRELLTWLRAAGPEAVTAELPSVMTEMSAQGWSRGDDISCAFLVNQDPSSV